MRLIYAFLLLSFVTMNGQEDFNFELVSSTRISTVDEVGNDIWGFLHSNGTEYAIMGANRSTKVYSLADPANPELVISVPGESSTWRDIKTFQDHIYVTADSGNDGLLVIDMSQFATADSIRWQYLKPDVTTTQGTEPLGNCHNIYIDENGFAYLAGCRVPGANQAVIMDLNQDLWNPPIVGVSGGDNTLYSHDLFVRNNIMYSSRIVADPGNMAILDVTDKANPVELGSIVTSNAFTHNIWLSDDDQFAFTTDEVENGYVDAYDISDPTSIKFLDKFRPLETENTRTIPHNTHYFNGYLVTSWYTDGLVMVDAHKPDNLIKVAAFDSYKTDAIRFNGCWGAFPYLPSGLMLASNINNTSPQGAIGELLVFRPTFVRACYLEGTITEKGSGIPINDAFLQIISDQQDAFESTDPAGEYKTGLATAGTYTVEVSHPDYLPGTFEAVLVNGEVTILNEELERLPESVFNGEFIDRNTGARIPNGVVKMTSPSKELNLNAEADGTFSFTVFQNSYEVVASAWGYGYETFSVDNIDPNAPLVIELSPGYYDDFEIDMGWTVNGDARTGLWDLGVPIATDQFGQFINPNADVPNDIGDECYVTENRAGSAFEGDVDDGTSRLTAPLIDVSDYENPVLQYRAWFWIGGNGGATPNDTMFLRIWDKTKNTTINMHTEITNGWTDEISIPLKDFDIDLTQELTFAVVIADDDEVGHLLEGGFDAFRIIDLLSSDTKEVTIADNVKIYPNPFSNLLHVELEPLDFTAINLFNQMGQLVYRTEALDYRNIINQKIEGGVYYLVLEKNDGHSLSQKVVKF